MHTVVDRVWHLVQKERLLRPNLARYVIKEATIWYPATLHLAVVARAADACRQEAEVGCRVLTVTALATSGND